MSSTTVDKAEKVRLRNLGYVKARRQRNKDFLNAYKLEQGCARCGYNKVAVALDFHHRDPADKSFPMAQAYRKGQKTIEAELAKCDVLCANCHREEEWG